MPPQHALKAFDPSDWYWHVTDGTHRLDVEGQPAWDKVYSSKRGKYVPINDPEYVAWCAAEPGITGRDRTTPIDKETDIELVLAARGITFGRPA